MVVLCVAHLLKFALLQKHFCIRCFFRTPLNGVIYGSCWMASYVFDMCFIQGKKPLRNLRHPKFPLRFHAYECGCWRWSVPSRAVAANTFSCHSSRPQVVLYSGHSLLQSMLTIAQSIHLGP